MSTYTLETKKIIRNDVSGERVEIGPDTDGLALVEIKSFTDDGKVGSALICTIKQALLIAQAIQDLYNTQ